METNSLLWLIALLTSWVSFGALFLWREARHSRQMQEMVRSQASAMTLLTQAHSEMLETATTSMGLSVTELVTLQSKSVGLLAAKDPLAYQQIEAMALPYGYSADQQASFDPSDEAELDRIESRSKRLGEEGDLSVDEQQRVLADLTGIDPEFFTFPPA